MNKKILGVILIIIIYPMLYILSLVGHLTIGNFTIVGGSTYSYAYLLNIPAFILYLSIIFTINFFFFNNKNYGLSFLIAGIFSFILIFLIGNDNAFNIQGIASFDLNGYLGIYFGGIAILILLIGIVLMTIKFFRKDDDNKAK